MNLPFLKSRKIPQLRKFAGESRYGFSEDDELIEHALDELIESIHNRDHAGVIEALTSLIHFIKNKEDTDSGEELADASNSLKDAEGV